MGMSRRDITVALMTAMQESSLRNLGGGDADSAGLFQQRPGQGWGSYSQVTNPLYATKKFFTVLKGVKGRNGLSLSGAAQAVQRSAFPSAYAKWESDALRLMGQSGAGDTVPFPVSKPFSGLDMDGSLAGTQAQTDTTPAVSDVTSDSVSPAAPGNKDVTKSVTVPSQPAPEVDDSTLSKFEKGAPSAPGDFPATGALVGGIRGQLIKQAEKALGTPYVWGGAAPGGFDCSGLIYYYYNRLGVKVPRVSQDQVNVGARMPINKLSPGDFVGFGSDAHHIAIYLGNGRILEAPHTGANVRIRKLSGGEDAFGVHLDLAGGDYANTTGAKNGAASQATTAANIKPGDVEDLALGVSADTPAGPIENFPGLTAETPEM